MHYDLRLGPLGKSLSEWTSDASATPVSHSLLAQVDDEKVKCYFWESHVQIIYK